jgi:group I intron endonuclease
MVGVYMIINPVNAKYVGSSINIERRIKQYKYLRIKEQHKIRNSINKYGYKNHRFIILELCNKDNLLEKERYWCIKHNVLHRYNLNLKIPLKGDKIKSFSKETLLKMSKIHKGKKLSKEQKDKLLSYIKGKKQSPEHIKKRIKYGKDNPAYGNAYFKGKKHTEETRKIISDKIKGMQLLGKNNKAKKVINIKTGEIYDCAKEVAILLNMNYSTLRAMLQNKNPNKTNFKYYETINTNTI